MKLIYIYILAIFATTNFGTFNIGPISPVAIIGLIISSYTILYLLKSKNLNFNPIRFDFLLIISWLIIILFLNNILGYVEIPLEAHSYTWAIGLNDTTLRGISFFIRLLLFVLTIEYFIIVINTNIKFIKILYFFIITNSIVSSYLIIQVIMYSVFDFSIGYMYFDAIPFRIGGYFGEPSLTASLLVGNIFILIYTIKSNILKGIIRNYLLKIFLIVSFIGLLFTLSSTWLVSLIFAYFINEFNSKKIIKFILSFSVCLIVVYLIPAFHEAILIKPFREGFGENPRTISWIAGIKIFLEHPLAGVGIGQSVFHMPVTMLNIWSYLEINENYRQLLLIRFPPMNTHIQWLAETGSVGMLLLVRLAYKLYSFKKFIDLKYVQIVRGGVGGAIVCYLLAINSVPDYYYVGYFNFLIGMYIAGINIYKFKSQ